MAWWEHFAPLWFCAVLWHQFHFLFTLAFISALILNWFIFASRINWVTKWAGNAIRFPFHNWCNYLCRNRWMEARWETKREEKLHTEGIYTSISKWHSVGERIALSENHKATEGEPQRTYESNPRLVLKRQPIFRMRAHQMMNSEVFGFCEYNERASPSNI